MKKTRVSLPEKGGVGQRQNRPIRQPRQTPVTTIPRMEKKHVREEHPKQQREERAIREEHPKQQREERATRDTRRKAHKTKECACHGSRT